MINGTYYKNALISGANNIIQQKEEINSLNIFPVPDGDTGTNMSMTFEAAAQALSESTAVRIDEVAAEAASAMLKSARGNSGVILSLLFRGIANGFKGKSEISGKDLADAFKIGVDTAYKAVMNPTEGTMLTVARMCYEAGKTAADVEQDPVIVFSSICSGANDALNRTPEMLPVLKKAGVVDAGGKGLCVIFEGMLSMFRDGVMVELDKAAMSPEAEDKAAEFFRNAAAEFDAVINFTYCTEFIIGKAPDLDKDAQELRAFLETMGDCVVVADDDDIIKVHVHTEHPGKAIEEALTFGQLLTVKIENMKEQHRKAAEKNEKEKARREAEEKKKEALKPVSPVDEVGFVAVAAGEGLENVFKDLGCQHVVSGGQSMNPSTDDIYQAVMATPAKNVFVLPNNKNIILAAKQVIPMITDRNVFVLHTKTIPAAKNVSTGQVTYAARNAEFGGTKIKEGDIIALSDGKLTLKSKDPVHAVVKLAKEMSSRDTSYISVIYGEGISEEQANAALEGIKSKVGGDIEVTLINGGQPVYYFILSVE